MVNWKDYLNRRRPKVIPPRVNPEPERPRVMETILFLGLALLALGLLFYIPIAYGT